MAWQTSDRVPSRTTARMTCSPGWPSMSPWAWSTKVRTRLSAARDPTGGVQAEAVPDPLGEEGEPVQPAGERDLTAVQPGLLSGDPGRGRRCVVEVVQAAPVDVSDAGQHDGLEPVELSEQHLALGQGLRALQRDRVLARNARTASRSCCTGGLSQDGRGRCVTSLISPPASFERVFEVYDRGASSVKPSWEEFPYTARVFPTSVRSPQITSRPLRVTTSSLPRAPAHNSARRARRLPRWVLPPTRRRSGRSVAQLRPGRAKP